MSRALRPLDLTFPKSPQPLAIRSLLTTCSRPPAATGLRNESQQMARQGPASGGGRVQPGPLSLIVCHGNALLRGLRASRSLGPGKAAPREQGLLGGLCFLHTWLRRGELGDSPPRKLASGDAAPSVEGPPFGELGWRLPCGELAWRPPWPIARDDWRCQTGPATLKTSSLEAALRRGPACGAVARRARVSPAEGRPGRGGGAELPP